MLIALNRKSRFRFAAYCRILNSKSVRMLLIKSSKIKWPKKEKNEMRKDFYVFSVCQERNIEQRRVRIRRKHSVKQSVTLDFDSDEIPRIQYFFLFIISYPTQFRFCCISFAIKMRATHEMKKKRKKNINFISSRSFFNILSTFARIYSNVNCQRIFCIV